MQLIALLKTINYDQLLHIFITNNYDQNVIIFDDQLQNFNFSDNSDLFDNLDDEVDQIIVNYDHSLTIMIKNQHFEEPLEKQYFPKYVEKWKDNNPDTRPYLDSCEINQKYSNYSKYLK